MVAIPLIDRNYEDSLHQYKDIKNRIFKLIDEA